MGLAWLVAAVLPATTAKCIIHTRSNPHTYGKVLHLFNAKQFTVNFSRFSLARPTS